jgi:hypothetical protein
MRKTHTAAFKAQVVQELRPSTRRRSPPRLASTRTRCASGEPPLGQMPSLFERRDNMAKLKATHEQQLSQMYKEIGRLTTQVNWLKKTVGAITASQDLWYTTKNVS